MLLRPQGARPRTWVGGKAKVKDLASRPRPKILALRPKAKA